MLLLIHLLIGNLLFFTFIWKRERVLALYAYSRRILDLNAQIRNGKASASQGSFYALPEASSGGVLKFIVFYLQFISIAWMLFLTTFAAAAIVYRTNPKIKEQL